MNDERHDESGSCFACNADISHAAGGDGYRFYRQADGKPEGETDAEVELCESCQEEAKAKIGWPDADVLNIAQFDELSAWIQSERRANGLNGMADQVEVLEQYSNMQSDALEAIKRNILEFHRECEEAEHTDTGEVWTRLENMLRLAQRALGQEEPQGFDEGKLLTELDVAERKAFDALSRYKFQMFGYWAAIWVHLNRIGGFKRPSPFKPIVNQARICAVGTEQLRHGGEECDECGLVGFHTMTCTKGKS